MSIRQALVAGFAVLIAVWAFASYELVRRLGDVEWRVTAEHAALARAAEAASVIRRNVLEASIDVRDALIDADPFARETYRHELRLLREASEAQLAESLNTNQSKAERDEWAKLQAKLDEFWPSL